MQVLQRVWHDIVECVMCLSAAIAVWVAVAPRNVFGTAQWCSSDTEANEPGR